MINRFMLIFVVGLGLVCGTSVKAKTVHLKPTLVAHVPDVVAPKVLPQPIVVPPRVQPPELTPIVDSHRYQRWEYRRGQPVRNVVRFFHNRQPLRTWFRNGDGPLRKFFRNGGIFRRGCWGF